MRNLTLALLILMVGCQPSEDGEPQRLIEQAGELDIAPAQADPDAARRAVADFHQALAAGDSARMLELLHPEAIIYEAGHVETVEEYRAGHLTADIRFAATTERELIREHAEVLDGVALYLSESRVRGAVGGREIDSRGAETMVLTRERDRWRIRHIHWSNR